MTNEKIGELIGLTYSAVSRLRRGERLPSVEVMVNIDKHFKWDVGDQVKVRLSGGPKAYAKKLNELIYAVVEKQV
jgi:transcriptional regulator with XRE-family HTH domain